MKNIIFGIIFIGWTILVFPILLSEAGFLTASIIVIIMMSLYILGISNYNEMITNHNRITELEQRVDDLMMYIVETKDDV